MKTPKSTVMWALWDDALGLYADNIYPTRWQAAIEAARTYGVGDTIPVKVKLVPVLPTRRKATKKAR